MAQIFISYRRSDSTAITGRIYDRLRQEFGKDAIFKDVDNIPAGRDFRGVLREATSNCGVMLVIIGPNWVNAQDATGNRRLDDLGDFVRLEVETGLQRDNVRVIPVLVNNATPPRPGDLPDSLRELAYNNAVLVRDDPDFHRDMDRLTDQLKPQIKRISGLRRPNIDWRWIVAAILIPLIAAIITIVPSLIEKSQNASATQGAQETQLASTRTAQLQPSLTSDTHLTAILQATLTSTLRSIETSTFTPTLDATQLELTIQSQTGAIQIEAKQTIDAKETATADFATAFAQQTLNAQATTNANETTTAPAWTSAPTVDMHLTSAMKMTQVVLDVTSTIGASWTNTPIPIISFTPTNMPISTLPNGLGLIAFVSTPDIYIMGADGTGVTRLTEEGRNDEPAWSPDGRRIAFTSYRNGSKDIYVMNADGSDVTRLTTNGDNESPAWSPDGRQIVFVSAQNRGHVIYIMSADGSGMRRLLEGGGSSPTWSPSGLEILFTSTRGGNSHIYSLNINTGQVKQLTTKGFNYSPAWSFDGQQIAFISGNSIWGDIYVMNADGSQVRGLTEEGENREPSWSPDGQWIVFQTFKVTEGAGSQIYMMKVDGNEIRPFWSAWGENPSWQPATSTFNIRG